MAPTGTFEAFERIKTVSTVCETKLSGNRLHLRATERYRPKGLIYGLTASIRPPSIPTLTDLILRTLPPGATDMGWGLQSPRRTRWR